MLCEPRFLPSLHVYTPKQCLMHVGVLVCSERFLRADFTANTAVQTLEQGLLKISCLVEVRRALQELGFQSMDDGFLEPDARGSQEQRAGFRSIRPFILTLRLFGALHHHAAIQGSVSPLTVDDTATVQTVDIPARHS